MPGAPIAESLREDGCYDLIERGVLVGRLVWVEKPSGRHRHAGWWLTVNGMPSELIYRVPAGRLDDLARARRDSVCMSLGLAEQILLARQERLTGRSR